MAENTTIQNKVTTTATGAILGGISKDEEINIAVYFDVITNHTLQKQNNITDNYLEDNTVVNDCIARAPMIITLSGQSAELVYVPSTNKGGWLNSLYKAVNDEIHTRTPNDKYIMTDKLTVIPQLFPPVDNITQTAKNIVTTVEGNVKRYKKIAQNLLQSKEQREESRLHEVYQKLTEADNTCKSTGKGLFILTPWGEMDNMFIQNITLNQDNYDHITGISVTLKQLGFSETKYIQASEDMKSEFNKAAAASVEDNGKVQGKKVSLLKQGINKGRDFILKMIEN